MSRPRQAKAPPPLTPEVLYRRLKHWSMMAGYKADSAQAANDASVEGYWTGVQVVLERLAEGIAAGTAPNLDPETFVPKIASIQGTLPHVSSIELPPPDDNRRLVNGHDRND